MTLNEQYDLFRQLVAGRRFQEAEIELQKIMEVPDQAWQQYLYQPAAFYESWGDYEFNVPAHARQYYQKALEFRYSIGANSTGSGEGTEAMYHIKRVQKKLKELEQ